MYDKILCIYPEDQTTDFLNSIPISIEKYIGDRFELFRIDITEESYQMALYKMQSYPNGSLILYLGHGSSSGFHCLQQSEGINIETCIFLNAQNIQRIQSKSLYALSCNSGLFLNCHRKKSNLVSWIGFGDLPTEYECFPLDIENKKMHLEKYKKIIVESVILSIIELISSKSISKSYSILKLYLNQKMIRLAADRKDSGNKLLADIIFRTKKEILISEKY